MRAGSANSLRVQPFVPCDFFMNDKVAGIVSLCILSNNDLTNRCRVICHQQLLGKEIDPSPLSGGVVKSEMTPITEKNRTTKLPKTHTTVLGGKTV